MSSFDSFSTAFSSLNSQTKPTQSYDESSDAMEDTDDQHTPTQQSFGSSIPYSQTESPQSSDGYVGSDNAMEDMLNRYTQTTRSFGAVVSFDSQGSDAVERDSDRVEKEERDRSDLFDEMIKQRVQEAVWKIPMVRGMSTFCRIPDGKLYIVLSTAGPCLVLMMDTIFPTGLEGPTSLYQATYQGDWVSEMGEVAQDIVSGRSLRTYRPVWLMNDTVSRLGEFGKPTIMMLESAGTKVGSRKAYRLTKVVNKDLALANILMNAIDGISTSFVFVRMQVKEGKFHEFHSFCCMRGMHVLLEDNDHYSVFEGKKMEST